jgi:Family of unknown function (DUF6161)
MTEDILTSVRNTEHPLLEVPETKNSPAFSPRSLDELEQWLRKEQEFWAWTRTVSQVPDISGQIHGENELFSFITSIRNNSENLPHRTQMLANIQNLLMQRYQQFQALHSATPKAQYLATLQNKVSAGHALRLFMGLNSANVGEVEAFRGSTLASVWELGLPGVQNAYEKAFEELRRKMEMEHEQLRRQAGKSADEFSKLEADVGSLHSAQRTTFDEEEAKRKLEFEQRQAVHDSQMSDIARSYKESMALRASVTYLTHGSKDRRKAWITTGIVTFLVGAVFSGAAFFVAREVLNTDKPEWHKIAPAALLATLMFWLIRILVRMFLSNLHQSSDMRARATLIQTYLALLAEGNPLKEDDRKLILQVIFRPISDGLVRDDAAPGGPWDLATRLLAGGGK